jgi:hypothetical protein
VLLTQEEANWLDDDGTISASKFLYYDRLPGHYGKEGIGARIRSKRKFSMYHRTMITSTMDQYSRKQDGQLVPIPVENQEKMPFTWGIMQIGGKNVLIISIHSRPSMGYYFNSEPTNGPVKDRKISYKWCLT